MFELSPMYNLHIKLLISLTFVHFVWKCSLIICVLKQIPSYPSVRQMQSCSNAHASRMNFFIVLTKIYHSLYKKRCFVPSLLMTSAQFFIKSSIWIAGSKAGSTAAATSPLPDLPLNKEKVSEKQSVFSMVGRTLFLPSHFSYSCNG